MIEGEQFSLPSQIATGDHRARVWYVKKRPGRVSSKRTSSKTIGGRVSLIAACTSEVMRRDSKQHLTE